MCLAQGGDLRGAKFRVPRNRSSVTWRFIEYNIARFELPPDSKQEVISDGCIELDDDNWRKEFVSKSRKAGE